MQADGSARVGGRPQAGGPASGPRLARAPFLALGFACLVVAIAGGLLRIGVAVPGVPAGAVLLHGPLMVVGFLGTLIGVERAAGSGRRWAWAAPLLTGAGALAALGSDGAPAARAAMAAGALGFAIVLADGLRGGRAYAPAVRLQLLGAAAFVIGTAAWAAGAPVPRALPWWSAFLVLTIVGERVELSRLLSPSRAAWHGLAAAAALLLAGAAASPWWPAAGARGAGLAWLAMAAWLGRWDLARRSLRRPGLPRFMGATLLAGHVWLAIAGALALAYGAPTAGPAYDAVLHALLLGFVFSMIFAHAPVIFPAVLGVAIPYRPRFYAHVVLLHAGLALRVAGDVSGRHELRAAGGVAGALAIALFLVQTASAAGRRD